MTCGDDCGGPGAGFGEVDRKADGSGVLVQTGRGGAIAWIGFTWFEAERLRIGIEREVYVELLRIQAPGGVEDVTQALRKGRLQAKAKVEPGAVGGKGGESV